jgi:hypothetical protein
MTESTDLIATNNCCESCVCLDPHRGAPDNSTENLESNPEPMTAPGLPSYCCEPCTCETPHQSKPQE